MNGGKLVSSNKSKTLSREEAYNSRPAQLPVSDREEKGGELHMTVQYDRPRWQRWMGAPQQCERTFILDALGREVYEMCDGSRTVQQLIDGFAARRNVSVAEAEYSVTTYLKTLLSKGLLAMVVK